MAEPDLSEPPISGIRAWDRSRLPVIPRWVGLIALAVVLLGASAWVIGQQFSSASPPRRGSTSYITFKDPTGLFQGGYPASWKRLPTSSPFVLLVRGPNGASYQVGKTTITATVNATNLTAALKLTERVVRHGPGVKLIATAYHQPEPVSLGGLPGYLYLYTFVDPTTGETGAHAHYFLFDGRTMITLVFQALPSNSFLSLAPMFDRIARTFQATSG